MNEQEVSSTTQPIVELFRLDCVAFWATTFTIDLAFYSEYLLRRLGDPPLNAVILVDRDRLDHSLDRAAERPEMLESANRSFLLRGVSMGRGRFHPKSYLSVHGRTATLTIGSGNLSRYGIDQGREIFVTFRSGTAIGDAAIASWREWIRQVVTHTADITLAERFADLEERLPQNQGLQSVVDSPLLHNLQRPLLEQFVAIIGDGPVDELHVLAPFYDETAAALGQMVNTFQPRRVVVYVTTSTSVNGVSLRERLESVPSEVEIRTYEPDEFTHAKLIGVTRHSTGWIMSGSANLSHAALTMSCDVGNVELAVVTQASPNALRAAFVPPGVEAELTSLEVLDGLNHRVDAASESLIRSLRLERVILTPDSQLHVVVDTDINPSWCLSDPTTSHGLRVDTTNPKAAFVSGQLSAIVRLTTGEGIPLSNWCLVEDPVALASSLVSGDPKAKRSSPTELTAGDLETPLGRALLFMHQTMVMDISELTSTASSNANEPDEFQVDNDDIWQRLEVERLQRDPRAAGYQRLLGRSDASSSALDEQIVELLEAMRLRVPPAPQLVSKSNLLGALVPAVTQSPHASQTWSNSARIRVRARNVLRRWAATQTDVRLAFVDPLAPLFNLLYITVVLLGLWPHTLGTTSESVELDEQDLQELWALWFQPLVGTGNNDGWLDRVNRTSDRYQSLTSDKLASNITALCWLAIRPGVHRRERIIEWQPFLRAAFEHNLINDSPEVATYLSAATATGLTAENVADDLLRSLEFIDDDLWCEQIASEFGLTEVELTAPSAGQQVAIRLGLGGIIDPLLDPRLPRLILRACHYRGADSIAVYALDQPWRLVIDKSEPAAYKSASSGELFDADGLTLEHLEHTAADGGVIGRWFPAAARAA